MMQDLFASPTRLDPVPLPGADVSYMREFDLGVPSMEMMRALIDETPWRQEDVKVWGKTFRQPRLVAWYGDPGHAYRYSGISLNPLPWTDRIAESRLRACHKISASIFSSKPLRSLSNQ